DRRRVLDVTFESAAVAHADSDAADPSPPSTDADSSRPVPAIAYVFGAVTVVGAAGFTYFALTGLHDKRELDACRPSCASDRIDAAKQKFLVADAFLLAGAAALAATIYVYVTRPAASPRATI